MTELMISKLAIINTINFVASYLSSNNAMTTKEVLLRAVHMSRTTFALGAAISPAYVHDSTHV